MDVVATVILVVGALATVTPDAAPSCSLVVVGTTVGLAATLVWKRWQGWERQSRDSRRSNM